MSYPLDSEPLLGGERVERRYDGRDPSNDTHHQRELGAAPVWTPNVPHTGLRRDLSIRQVSMIAIGGTIGTGLFLGTGRSLAQGGPASILICYGIVGFIVYITVSLLGELATQYPVAGSFTVYTARFFSPSYAFALSWNYWFNDAVSVASDLTAAQLVLHFWTDWHPWVISVVFLAFLLGVNALSVRSYGEMEYILSSLKVFTVVLFIIVGALVNAGVNRQHTPIGTRYWHIPGAPFVDGIAGFARVFVTASFAYGGTESLAITAGETKNPTKNMPRIVRVVFWRILLFYIFSILMIGLNVPYDYPNLSNRSTTTSPFTIVFREAGSNVAASFMNTVILTSVLSAGNHALYAGTRILYSLSTSSPALAPRFFSQTTSRGVPLRALLGTASISALCFSSSFIGSGELWGWLQNIVGVSNQIAWLSIGIASWRFRKAWTAQGRSLSEMKFRANWTWPWGAPFVVFSVSLIILFQGWTSFYPLFSFIDFLSLYLELPVMAIMTFAWYFIRHRKEFVHSHHPIGSDADVGYPTIQSVIASKHTSREVVDVDTVDLYADEHFDDEHDAEDDALHAARRKGRWGWFWRLYDIMA
ncbi:ALP1_1 [Sanghuangporus sanghuang]